MQEMPLTPCLSVKSAKVEGSMSKRWALTETLRTGAVEATARIRKAVFDAALAAKIVEGHDDYVKFVILGRGRTGSNYLRTSLASHRHAVVFGELFNNRARARGQIVWGGYPGYRSDDPRLVSLRERDVLAFLDRAVFATMPKRIHAVGFKLFYYHARHAEWSPVWTHLRDLDVRAIHLKRRNLLAGQVSAMMAEASGTWLSKHPARETPREPIVLSYDKCLRFFERSRELEAAHANSFDRMLDLYYEDLVDEYEKQTHAVQEFLGLPPQALSSPLQKQARLPLHESIANFHELKEKFAATEWSIFFD